VFEMAATETITSIILIKLIRVSLGTVRHPRRFKIVVIDIQITLKQMLRDFIGIRVNRAKKRSEERFSRNAETEIVCRLLPEKKKIIHFSEAMYIVDYAHFCGIPRFRFRRYAHIRRNAFLVLS